MSFQEPGVFPVMRIPSIVRQPTLVRDHSLDLWEKKSNTKPLYGTKQNDGWPVRQQPVNEQIGPSKWNEKVHKTKVKKDGSAEYLGHPACSELSLRHQPSQRTLKNLKDGCCNEHSRLGSHRIQTDVFQIVQSILRWMWGGPVQTLKTLLMQDHWSGLSNTPFKMIQNSKPDFQ